MDKEKILETSNTEMLAILRAEYERLQAEHEQLKEQLRKKELAYAKLEEKMDHLLEYRSVWRSISNSVHLPKNFAGIAWSS